MQDRANDTFDKWNRWLETITDDVTILVTDKHIFWEIQDMRKKNQVIQKPGNRFFESLERLYAESALMRIRKQIKSRQDSTSLARLLSQIANDPGFLSRKRFADAYRFSNPDSAVSPDTYFDQLFAGNVDDHVDPELVKKDLEELRARAEKVEYCADKAVAHHDRGTLLEVPTFGEVNDCVDLLEKLTIKYRFLFRGVTFVGSLLPEDLGDWKAIFKIPWLL